VVTVPKISATGTPSASTYLRGDGAWETPAGGGGSTSSLPAINPPNNHYLIAQMVADSLTTNTQVANRMVFAPFIPGKDYTVNAMGISVTGSASGALARAGIYASDSNGRPTGSPLVTTIDLNCAISGIRLDQTISFNLTAGTFYYLAVHPSSTPTLRAMGRNSMRTLFIDINTILPDVGWTLSNQTFASGMPDVTSATFTPYDASVPIVYLRVT